MRRNFHDLPPRKKLGFFQLLMFPAYPYHCLSQQRNQPKHLLLPFMFLRMSKRVENQKRGYRTASEYAAQAAARIQINENGYIDIVRNI